jgi:RNA polymerase sigma-70 factor (ECF subfamily)
MPDAAVITASVRRPSLFAEVFDRHAADLLRYLTRRIGANDAEDVLGDTFTVAFERRESFDPAAPSARPWLYGIASNLIHRRRRDEVRFLRALARVSPSAPESTFEDDVASRVDSTERVRGLAGALASLSAGDREVLLLVVWAQLSHEDVSVALEIPVGTVKSRMHRARRILRDALEQGGVLEGAHPWTS